MRLRLLNDTLIVDPDSNLKHDGVIQLCDDNSVEKISYWATIIAFGNKCSYPFKIGQRVLIDRFFDKPEYIQINNKKYRLIKEHYIHAVDKDD